MSNTCLLIHAKENEFKMRPQLDFQFNMEIEAYWRYLICPPLTFMKVALKADKYFKKIVSVLISGIREDNMPDSGRIFRNCHITGVGLRSTVLDFIWFNLCLGKVHIIWQKTGKSSLLPSQPVSQVRDSNQKIRQPHSFLHEYSIFQAARSGVSSSFLSSLFVLDQRLEVLVEHCARCVIQHGEMLGCNWWWCTELGL